VTDNPQTRCTTSGQPTNMTKPKFLRTAILGDCSDAALGGGTDFLRLLSETMQSTSSSLQFVQGAPCSVTLHRTLRARQHWQALDARRFTERPVVFPSRPAWVAFRLMGCDSRWSEGEAE
jgi:hypothetical protein